MPMSLFPPWQNLRCCLFLFEIVIVHFYTKYDAAADGCNQIGYKKSPKDVWLVQDALHHEAHTSYSHHEECWQCYAVGILRANGFYGLWQIAKYHCYACHPSQQLICQSLIHGLTLLIP